MTANRDAFLGELFSLCARNEWGSVDGDEIQDMLLKHGFATKRPATEDDCADERFEYYDVEPGDPILIRSDKMKALMTAAASQQGQKAE